MRIVRMVLAASASLVFVFAGCSSSNSSGSSTCTAGRSLSCTGPSGCTGFQVCAADGKSYTQCRCGVPEAGPDSSALEGGSGGSPADSGKLPEAGDASDGGHCDLVAQTGCTGGDRCGLLKQASTYSIGCSPAGAQPLWAPCTFDASTGRDDCATGLVCNGGECRKACDTGSPLCPPGGVCVTNTTAGTGTFGVCEPACDPVAQTRTRDGAAACGSPNPASPSLGCYGVPGGVFTCAPVVNPGNVAGTVVNTAYLNVCAAGFFPMYMSWTQQYSCVPFCTPVATTLESHPSPGGAVPHTCSDRGASSSECRFKQFVDGVYTGPAQATVGICVDYMNYQYQPDPSLPSVMLPSCTTISGAAPLDGGIPDAVTLGCVPIP